MNDLLQEILNLLKTKGPLKAKDIASFLNLTKTEVNSELYRAKDVNGLAKDEKNTWSYKDANIVRISFNNNSSSWLSAWNIESVLKLYPDLLLNKSKIEFHFPNKPIFLDCILKILSFTNQLVRVGSQVTLKFDNECDSFRYLSRCGFFDNIHKDVTVLPYRPEVSLAEMYYANSDNLFEIFAIKNECDESLLSRITKLIEDRLSENDVKKLLNKILTLIGELVDNIHQHGLSEIDGYIALQVYNSRKIVISISDSGDGLINTLRNEALMHYENDPELRKFNKLDIYSDIQLIGYVFNKGRISRTGIEGRGLGLSKSNVALRKISIDNVKETTLSIRQNNHELKFLYDENGIVIDNCKIRKDLTHIDGTHYVVTIKT